MDVSTILQAITSVGFPIVCCLVMMYYVKYTDDRNRADTEKLNALHREEMKEVTTAITNNTLVIQQLVDFIKAETKETEK